MQIHLYVDLLKTVNATEIVVIQYFVGNHDEKKKSSHAQYRHIPPYNHHRPDYTVPVSNSVTFPPTLNIFNLRLFESTDVEHADMGGRPHAKVKEFLPYSPMRAAKTSLGCQQQLPEQAFLHLSPPTQCSPQQVLKPCPRGDVLCSVAPRARSSAVIRPA